MYSFAYAELYNTRYKRALLIYIVIKLWTLVIN